MSYKIILFVRSYGWENRIIWCSIKENGVLADLFVIQEDVTDGCEIRGHTTNVFVNPDTKYNSVRQYNRACLIFLKTLQRLQFNRR